MHADKTIDLRDQLCPMTFVRTRLALDSLQPGETLLILLHGEEPQTRVPHTVRQLGHQILDSSHDSAGLMHLLVRKAGLQPGADLMEQGRR